MISGRGPPLLQKIREIGPERIRWHDTTTPSAGGYRCDAVQKTHWRSVDDEEHLTVGQILAMDCPMDNPISAGQCGDTVGQIMAMDCPAEMRRNESCKDVEITRSLPWSGDTQTP